MQVPILLITPPFTQLNTPYPATAYLKGFLQTKGIASFQCDLGIEVILELFSKQGLERMFQSVDKDKLHDDNLRRIYHLREQYIHCVDALLAFLQGKQATLSDRIVQRNFLPEASRFDQLEDMVWAFGEMGLQDKAQYLGTLFLEDLSDFIKACVDEHFGFSRYAEQLARSARQFNEIHDQLQQPLSFIDRIHLDILSQKIEQCQPQLVAFSVPFPGNLFSAFRAAQWIKKHHPEIRTAMGGGFPNTELRSLGDVRVMAYFDFMTLDDGEAPMEGLYEYIKGLRPALELKRTFLLNDGQLTFINNTQCRDYAQTETGTPDYSDLLLDRYISVIEVANPMHRLWSDGRWNKLTMAHGCYWGKCTFCDIHLPYIRDYEPLTAALLCDRMETIMAQTGHNGFHFVDEAAPPALMRALALEILRRKLVVSWWTNIRFEKSFTRDLCLLLQASGCIAVSGGLEVASDRLLELIQKGVTVAQVARVTQHFTQAGIMVHAYLMYGYPTQTVQETVDSLDMVRQLFAGGVLQSAFWHRFALTAHSPVGHDPKKYKIDILDGETAPFANNDLEYREQKVVDHEQFSFGLKKSLYNYMHHIGLDKPLQEWFEQKIPATSIPKDFIQRILDERELPMMSPHAKIVFTGQLPVCTHFIQSKKGRQREMMSLTFQTSRKTLQINLPAAQGQWVMDVLPLLHTDQTKGMNASALQSHYSSAGLEDFDLFWFNKPMNQLYEAGLLVL